MSRFVVRALALRLAPAALALTVLASPGRAVTCEEARGLSASALNDYAARLEVSPAYLSALLEKAFCEMPATGDRATTAPERKRAPNKRRSG
jgi:hypothetical protein